MEVIHRGYIGPRGRPAKGSVKVPPILAPRRDRGTGEAVRMSEAYPYNGRLSRWEEVAPGLVIVGVESQETPFPFAPGQYATLGLVGAEGKLVQRPMSISSSSDDLHEYEFFIRLVEGGAFTTLLWERKVGDPINIKGPKGRFLLQ